MRGHIGTAGAVLGFVALLSFALGPAAAQVGPAGADANLPATPETSDQTAAQPGTASVRSSLGAFGDPGGVAASLGARGLTYSFTYIGETLGNFSGGQRRGAIYEGRLDTQIDLDLDKAVGWTGAAIHANTYQIHGHGLSRYYLANLAVVSGIEALSSNRLYELWFEQKLLEDRLAVRVGQVAADTEFLVSQYAALFVNSSFGWPAITAANLPNGGPAYPLATPGLRVRFAPDAGSAFLLGLYNGAPAGRGPGDPQRNDPTGLEFRLRDPAFLIGEACFGFCGNPAAAVPGTVKFGVWHQFGRTNDPRYTAEGGLVADPTGAGIPGRLAGNGGAYAVVEGQVFREAADRDQGLAAFARLAVSPGDRNLVGVYADGGLTYKGLLPGRPDDTVGIGAAYIRVAAAVRAADRDLAAFTVPALAAVPIAVRSDEIVLEATYQALIVPGWTVQPDLQYIVRPGGHVVNGRSPVGAIERNAVVAGLRTSIRY